MLDILIKDGTVVDGTGKPAFKADVGVAAGRITVVAESIGQNAEHTIQAQGLHLAPGFIDPHTHSDLTLLANPRAESKIRQGITTEVVGNCGISPAPLLGAAVEEVRAEAKVPYEKWVRWYTPLFLIFVVEGAIFCIIAQIIQYGPF